MMGPLCLENSAWPLSRGRKEICNCKANKSAPLVKVGGNYGHGLLKRPLKEETVFRSKERKFSICRQNQNPYCVSYNMQILQDF